MELNTACLYTQAVSPAAFFCYLGLLSYKDLRNKDKNPVVLVSLKIGTELAMPILIKGCNSSAINIFSLAELSGV